MSKANEIVFVDTHQEVIDTMRKLAKTALRSGGKVVAKHLKEDTHKRTEDLVNQIGYWAKIDRMTGQPSLDIGYYSTEKMKKVGKPPSHSNPSWFEFGVKAHKINVKNANTLTDGRIDFGKSVQHPGLREEHILRNAVYDNLEEILEAEEKYLGELNKTIEEAKSKIEESEEEEFV